MKKFLFPFNTEKYKFLEGKWRHRLMKIIFFLTIGIGFCLSIIIYSNAEINTVIGPNYSFKGGRWINQAFQDTMKEIPQETFDTKYYNLDEEMKNVFKDLRADINKGEGRKINMNKLMRLYPELYEAKFGPIYYIGYYIQITFYVIASTYILLLLLQLLYFKGIIYVVYGNGSHVEK